MRIVRHLTLWLNTEPRSGLFEAPTPGFESEAPEFLGEDSRRQCLCYLERLLGVRNTCLPKFARWTKCICCFIRRHKTPYRFIRPTAHRHFVGNSSNCRSE